MTEPIDTEGPDAALRADIRRLGTLLGQTLARQEGRPLLDLVEEIRALVRSDAGGRRHPARGDGRHHRHQAGPRVLHLLPPGQHHRAGAPRPRAAPPPGRPGRLAGPGGQDDRRAGGAGRGDRGRRAAARRTPGVHRPPDRGRPPVDPVEAARRRRRARRRGRRRGPVTAPCRQGADDRRLAELLDLLWQTDELRLDRPDPTDEARNAIYYLRDLYAEAAPAGARRPRRARCAGWAWRPRRPPGR